MVRIKGMKVPLILLLAFPNQSERWRDDNGDQSGCCDTGDVGICIGGLIIAHPWYLAV